MEHEREKSGTREDARPPSGDARAATIRASILLHHGWEAGRTVGGGTTSRQAAELSMAGPWSGLFRTNSSRTLRASSARPARARVSARPLAASGLLGESWLARR